MCFRTGFNFFPVCEKLLHHFIKDQAKPDYLAPPGNIKHANLWNLKWKTGNPQHPPTSLLLPQLLKSGTTLQHEEPSQCLQTKFLPRSSLLFCWLPLFSPGLRFWCWIFPKLGGSSQRVPRWGMKVCWIYEKTTPLAFPSLNKTELSLAFLRRKALWLTWSQGALQKQLLLAVQRDVGVVFYTIYVLAEVFTPVS